ncbi:MAG: response regulator [Flavobacterium sp.]
MIRIAIIDDHTLIRKSLILLLNEIKGLKVVFDSDDGDAFLSYLMRHNVDLVLLDLQMPKMDGFTLCQLIRKQFPDLKILAVSQLMTEEVVYRVIKSGANGYLSKVSDPDQFKQAIENVMKLDYFFTLPLSDVLIKSVVIRQIHQSTLPKITADIISPREREILILTAQGYTTEEISKHMCLSIRTIDSHKRNVIAKMGCYNIIGVIVKCLTEYVIHLDELKSSKN